MGLAKTRLAAGVGRTEARRIARFTLARTMQAAIDPAWQTRLMIEPLADLNQTLGGIWPSSVERYPQAPGDLTDRLTKGMLDAPHGPVIFIGTDAPSISRALLRECVRRLKHDCAVFGPASDGGFWLFGVSHSLRDPALFEGVRWSGPHAMVDVRARLPARARVSLLPQLIDIDTAADWKMFKTQKF